MLSNERYISLQHLRLSAAVAPEEPENTNHGNPLPHHVSLFFVAIQLFLP